MGEGVNGSSAISFHDWEKRCRSREPDSVEAGPRQGSIKALVIEDDSVSLNSEQPDALMLSKSDRKVECQNCAFPVLSKLVARILQDQHTASRLEDGELETTIIDDITPEIAKTLVANDGHWKPNQTASRIMSFALTISGNNPGKVDKIKESIINGFQMAGESFGGELPEISGKTLTAVIGRLDEWAGNTGNKR